MNKAGTQRIETEHYTFGISITKEKQVSSMAACTEATIWCLLSIWQINDFPFVKVDNSGIHSNNSIARSGD